MSWERFSYICRKAKIVHKVDDTMANRIAQIESEPSCKLYGEEIRHDSLCRKILSDIGKKIDEVEAKNTLDIYSKINLSQHLNEPMQFKRVTMYLAYVTIIFYFISGIYQFKVAPTFLESFEIFEIPVPSDLLFYVNYWKYFVLFISVLLFISLLVGFTLKGLFKFKQGSENSFALKFLAFKGIRKSYIRLINLLYFPVSPDYQNSPSKTDELNTHLSNIRSTGMDISIELQALIEVEIKYLLEKCEQQMRFLSIFTAIIILLAISSFLSSAYSPIFTLGETV